ncbi:MAG: hypothetical protein WCO00_11210 [Rhodospirillaceae bacterium]
MTTRYAQPAAEAPILAIIASAADLARELLEVLQREAQALATMRLEAPSGFTEIKNRLVVAYGYKLEELQEAPMAAEAEAALAELKTLNAAVMSAARTNAAALEGAMEGNRRLLEIVVKAVEQQRAPATVGYGRVGNRAAPPRRAQSSASMMITRNL